jgi:hypothetical protein
MKKIYRYELEITDRPKLDLPAHAWILSAASSRNLDGIEIWILVDPTQPLETRELRVVGTGNPIVDDCGRFIGTVITHGGNFVWHVFAGNADG